MECITLSTKLIDQVCFDKDKNELLVYFQKGNLMCYYISNEEIFKDFVNDKNPDSYYRKYIMPQFGEIR